MDLNLEKYGYERHYIDHAKRSGKIAHASGSVFTINGYNLITKVDMRDLKFIQDDERVIVYDCQNDIVMDVKLDDIVGWQIKDYGGNMEEHVFTLVDRDFYCKMFVNGYDETY